MSGTGPMWPAPTGIPMSGEAPIGPAMQLWVHGRLARRQINGNTAYQQQMMLAEFATHVGDERPVSEVTTQDIEGWLALPRRNGKPYSPTTINDRSNPVRTFFRWAQQSGYIQINPAAPIGRARTGKRLPKGLTKDDVHRLLWVSDFRTKTIVLVGLQLGLRRAEIARMRLEHWDRCDQVLFVIGKLDKERSVPVVGEVAEALGLWTELGLRGARSGPMWPSKYPGQEHISGDSIGRLVTQAAEVAGVDATAHSLRHTCASDMVADGIPINIVQHWLGHENLSTTSMYVGVRAEQLKPYADRRRYLPDNMAMPSTTADEPRPAGPVKLRLVTDSTELGHR